MNCSDQDDLVGVLSGDELRRELRQRRKPSLETTVPMDDVDRRTGEGWEVVRYNKRTARLRKPKPIDQTLEDDVWTLLALMGFDYMNQGRQFRLPVSASGAHVPPKQIDVLAVDSETALVVECKASESSRTRSLQKDLSEFRGLQNAIRSAVHSNFDGRPRVCFLFATRNIRWSRPDRARARDYQISIVRDRQIDYYRRLIDIIGPAARHQLQADLLEGSPIPGLRTTVPALRGTFGSKRFYQFVIEPDRLLKLAYVSHRSKIDADAVGTYQRLLRKKRLNPNPPKGWRYSSRMGDEWQRGAMVRAGFRVDGSGGGLQQPRGDLVAVCERWQGEMAGRGRSKRHSRTGVARVCGAVG